GTGWSVSFPDVEVRISTTQRGPDQLSTVFDENVGADDTVVYSGPLTGTASGGQFWATNKFGLGFVFAHQFLYDPRIGNLLFDLRILTPNTNTQLCNHEPSCWIPLMDAWDRTNDTVSSVYSSSVFSSTGVVQSLGLATVLLTWPNPQLLIDLSTNSL